MPAAAAHPTADAVAAWLRERGEAFDQIVPLAGDVSPRRYLRVERSRGRSRIAAHYPPDLIETGERFVATTELLSAAAIPVPTIDAWDPDAGVMLLEDLGDRSLYATVSTGEPPLPRWREAIEIAGRVAALDPAAVDAVNPPLDTAILKGEIRQSWELVLAPSGLIGTGRAASALEEALVALCATLGAAARRPCHRDFMARNLIVDPRGRLVVIDHQDLRAGPPYYDLASLLNDSLYAPPDAERELLAFAGVTGEQRKAYHGAAALRALKIVGTFTAFARRGFDRHLSLVRPSLVAARRHLLELRETAAALRELAPAWDEVAGPV